MNKRTVYLIGTFIIIAIASGLYAYALRGTYNVPVASYKASSLNDESSTKTVDSSTQASPTFSDATRDAAELRRYTNVFFNYSFTYPNDRDNWSLDARDMARVLLTRGKSGDWRLSVISQDVDGSSLDELTTQAVAKLIGSDVSEADIEKRPISLSGDQGQYFSVKRKSGYGNAGVVAVHGVRVYYIFGDDSTEENKQELDTFLAGFEFASNK